MMNMLCGLQAAHRNCIFFRLTNWRNFPRACTASKRLPQVPGSPVGNQCQGQSPRKNPGLLCSLMGIPSSSRSCSSSQEQLLKTRCRGTWKGISRGSQRSHFSSMEGAAILTLSGFVPGKGFPVRGTDVVHSFHTSSRLWAAPAPLLWILLKPMQKLLAIIVGRGIRKWWQTLPPNKKELFKESIKKNKWKLFLGSSSLGILFIVFYFTHLEESPVTGRKKLLVLGKEQFMMLSQMEYDAWMEEFKDDFLPEKDPRYLAVKKVLQHLVESNSDIPGMSEFQWTIHMVDRPSVNAFVLPNGQVFVFTGLLEAVSDIHQLTFLLGHEIAHAVLGHAAEKASLVHLWDFLGLILLTMIWALCPRDSLAVLGQWIQSKLKEYVFDRPYSRTLEAEADTVGLQFAAKACVDVRACSVFWQQLEFADRILGEPRLPEWLSTHPSHENRAEHLERLIPQAIKIRESCKCPPLSGPDPRMLFRLRVKHFLEVTEEEDRNISAALVKKHKLDSLPIQKKETIPLTFMVDKRTGS